MSIRKIKDAKDLNNNELIYFKGHAKATYMSDGSTVEDAIKNIEANGGGGGTIDLSDYETKTDAQLKLTEAKSYTDIQILESYKGIYTQTLQLSSGFNWVSFFVDITLNDLQESLGTKGLSIETSLDGGTTILNSVYNTTTNTWTGNLDSIEKYLMYNIEVYEDCTIQLTGKLLELDDINIVLKPGNNYLGYPLTEAISVADVFSEIENNEGDYIKSKGSFDQFEGGEWGIGFLEYLEPGKGYIYTNMGTTDQIIQFKSSNQSISQYETKEDALAKLEEAKDYTDTAIANLVDSAPETLNTLNELAVAIQENENIVEVLNQSIGSKQDAITDLETIRQGAAKGATALQEHQDISGKADVDGNPNGIVVKEDNPQTSINIRPYGIIESESWKYNDVSSTEWIPDFLLSGNLLALGSGISAEDGFKIEALQNIRTQDRSDEEFLRTSHTMIQQFDERGNLKGTGLLLTDDFIQLYAYNPESEIDVSENMIELEDSGASFNDSIYDTRLRGIAEPISNHDAVNKKYVDDNYVSVNSVKTINGESLLGEGDIVISGGSNSSGGAYALVEHGTNDTTFMLTPNTFHVWDEVANLTLTLGSETTGVANEYLFQFTSGSEPTTLILPDNVKFNLDFTIEENKIYQISILNRLGTVMSWDI